MNEGKNKRPSSKEAKAKRNQTKRNKAVRNRVIALCVIAVALIAAIAVLVCKLTGVFDKATEMSTLTLTEDGKVICEEVTSFDEDFYDKGDLKKFVKSEIAKYNDKAGSGKVKLDSLKVSGKTAYAKTTYASYKDYRDFTGIELYVGKVQNAKKTYDFADAFVTVKEGVKGTSVETLDITSQPKLKVLVVKENITVVVPGEVIYVSDGATTMVDKNTVTIAQPDGNEDATQLTYILYE
ncbi:MAG: hypothetical protein PUB19_02695 [Lachnospiraceae bacterium]|nr:hypothetical protein [Lachnospiraceae bacterium]